MSENWNRFDSVPEIERKQFDELIESLATAYNCSLEAGPALEGWLRTVEQTLGQYDSGISDYITGLMIRRLIEDALQLADLPNVRRVVTAMDEEFRQHTSIVTHPVVPQGETADHERDWFQFRIPKRCGSEMQKGLKTMLTPAQSGNAEDGRANQ